MKELPGFTGRCQCGAVRYTVAAGPGKANACFCNMCKRATGSPVPAFISVPRERVTWQGTPAIYASSDTATRAFCRTCGTPLCYAGNDSSTWGLTAGSAEISISPDIVFYYDQHPEWLSGFEDLPKHEFNSDACRGDENAAD